MNNQIKSPTSKVRSTWALWLFPVMALGICGYLFADYLRERGPTVKISFDEASSLQPEKTRVKFRGVSIGLVKKVYISKDNKDVVAEISLQRNAKQFAVEGSKFWVVSPKVGLSGISGLETIFEGTYIAVHPGDPDGPAKNDFKGKLSEEVSQNQDNTSTYLLESPSVESVSTGDSVTFRGLAIGTVTNVGLSKNSQLGVVQISIQNKYVKLIRTNTVFWRKVGIQAKLGLFGSEVKVNSMDSILHGGVELFTPDNPGEVAKALAKFPLLSAPPKGSEKWNPVLE